MSLHRADSARNRAGSWLVRQKSVQAPRMRLFCFPYAGGGASIYREWGALLPEEVEVVVLQLPGRETRLLEEPITDAGKLTDALVDAMGPVLDLPFSFFGHSMGTVVSFELARELRRRGARKPSQLFLSAGRAPHIADPDSPIHELPDDAFLAELRQRYDGIPGEVLENEELLSLVLPGLRGDMKLLETHSYVEEAPLDVPITCYGGRDDKRLSHEDLEGWSRHTSGAFALRRLPGDHFFLHSQRSLLLRYLSDDLIQLMKRIEGKASGAARASR